MYISKSQAEFIDNTLMDRSSFYRKWFSAIPKSVRIVLI